MFAFLYQFGEGLDHLGIVDVPPLRDLSHGQVFRDQQAQSLHVAGAQAEPGADPLGDLRSADAVIVAVGERLARVVEDERQIQQVGTIEPFEDFAIPGVVRFFGFPNRVELFQADDRMFVGGVNVVELVLHFAGQPFEFRQVFAEQPDFVHGAHRAADVPLLIENLDEGFPDVGIAEKGAIGQRELGTDGIGQVGVEFQASLLSVAKDPHQSVRLFLERTGIGLDDLPVFEFEAVQQDWFLEF